MSPIERFLVIADDITGANDTGVMLARCGMPAVVVLDTCDDGSANIVLDTETRPLAPEEAYREMRRLAEGIDFGGFGTVVKKVDSTLRGNIAEEVLAIDELYRPELILFMPALPDLGRTTCDGVHMLHGQPVSQTEMKVPEDNISKILHGTHFSVGDIEAGRLDFSQSRVFTSDALTNGHMKTVAEAAKGTGKKILWVGSAALVDNLVAKSFRPALALTASTSEVSRRQVKFAEEIGVSLVVVPCESLVTGDLSEYIREAVGLLEVGKDVVILTGSTYKPMEPIPGAGPIIQAGMGKIGAAVLEDIDVSGVFLTGGDTAMGFFREIGANRFDIISEVLVGIPLLKVRGGRYDGMKVVTKAGAFGGDDAVAFCLRKIKENSLH